MEDLEADLWAEPFGVPSALFEGGLLVVLCFVLALYLSLAEKEIQVLVVEMMRADLPDC